MTVPGYNGPNWIDMLIEKGVYWNYGFHYDDKYIYLPMEELWDHYGLTQNFVRNEFYSTAYLMYEYLKTCKDNPNACMNNSILSLQHNDYTNYKLPEQTKEYLELWEL